MQPAAAEVLGSRFEFLPPSLAASRLRRELVTDELLVVDGVIPLPQKPGLGVTVNEAELPAFNVA